MFREFWHTSADNRSAGAPSGRGKFIRDAGMIKQIESKVVNRLRQVTSAIKQDGANQVSIIASTAERQAAVEFARRGGARIVEGYPVDPNQEQADAFVYTGLASAFRKAGFKEVLRRSPTRPMMRRVIRQVS